MAPWKIVQGAGTWQVEDEGGTVIREAMTREHAQLLVRVRELRAALKELEWSATRLGHFPGWCPSCGAAEFAGDPPGRHEDGCKLSALLAATEIPGDS